jgi:hypothetical protein
MGAVEDDIFLPKRAQIAQVAPADGTQACN